MQEEWWYATDEARLGPISIEGLRKNIIDGKLSINSLVWKDGMLEWTPLSNIPEFEKIVEALPPDLPQRPKPDLPGSLPVAGPWHRFFARFIDGWVITTIIFIPMVPMLADNSFEILNQIAGLKYMLGLVLTPVVLGIDAAIFGAFGTTLGKFLLAVKVTTINGQRPTAAQYLHRQIGVYWFGYGTGFPISNIFTFFRQYHHVKAGRKTSYDEGKFNVRAPKLGFFRFVGAFAAAGGVVLVLFLIYIIYVASGR